MRNRLTNELAVCGLQTVAALAEEHPAHINRLFIRQDRLPLFAKACKTLAERKHPYKICEDEELERMCGIPRHQGVVAMIAEPEVRNVNGADIDFWAREGKTGVFLHSIGSDYNLGAIVRSAAFFDAHFIVLSERDAPARLSGAAYRAAEGGMEYVVFRKVRDMAAFLRDASKALITIGAERRSRQRIDDMEAIIRDKQERLGPQFSRMDRAGIMVVISDDEAGLPPDIQSYCSALVRIPGTGFVESIDAAHAASLFLHRLSRP
ncbi:MAG: RNA methyltransferase [Spirochaetaceae bacterium]|jgi:TrmH RNA methyltransferase|nr:RNA methyltransferase [Spirochaetaceae bacterium]